MELDPANAPLNMAPVTMPDVGDVVIYLTKTDGAKVPAMVNAVFPGTDRVSLRIFNPQHVAEDPIDSEQLAIPDAVSYLPGENLPGRWWPRD